MVRDFCARPARIRYALLRQSERSRDSKRCVMCSQVDTHKPQIQVCRRRQRLLILKHPALHAEPESGSRTPASSLQPPYYHPSTCEDAIAASNFFFRFTKFHESWCMCESWSRDSGLRWERVTEAEATSLELAVYSGTLLVLCISFLFIIRNRPHSALIRRLFSELRNPRFFTVHRHSFHCFPKQRAKRDENKAHWREVTAWQNRND